MLPAPNSSRASLVYRMQSQKGETLAETLVAMLIAGLSLLMLSQTISVAAGIIQKNGETARVYYTYLNKLASPTTSGGTVTMSSPLVATNIPIGIKYYVTPKELPGTVKAKVVSYELQ